MSIYLISCLQAAFFKGYSLFCGPRLLCSEHDFTYLLIGIEVTSHQFLPHPPGHPEISSNCHVLMLPSSHTWVHNWPLNFQSHFFPLDSQCHALSLALEPLSTSSPLDFLHFRILSPSPLPSHYSGQTPSGPSSFPPIYSCILLHSLSSSPTSSLKCPHLQSTAPSWVVFLPD